MMQLLSRILLIAFIAILAFGIGTQLRFKDFGEIFRKPWALLAALFVQMAVFPVIAYVIGRYAGIEAEYKVGLMLIAAAPTAIFSNSFSLLLRGNLAFSASFGTINSLVAIFSIPFILYFSFIHFIGLEGFFWYTVHNSQFDTSLLCIAVIPISILVGIIVASKASTATARIQKYIRPMAILVGVLSVVLPLSLEENATIGFSFEEVRKLLVPVGLLYFSMIALGFGLAFVLRVDSQKRNTLLYELGLQNFWFAIVFAMGLGYADNWKIALPALVYGLVSVVSTLIFGVLINRREIEWRKLLPIMPKSIQENGIRSWVTKRWKLFLFLLFPIFSLLLHAHLFDHPLQGIHAWRQCETASNIANFSNGDMNIMDPQVFSLEWRVGYKRMEFPIMQWVFALFWRAFGQHIWIVRALSWLLGYLATIAVFRLTDRLFKDQLTALATAWAWIFSPVLFYYSINPLPDNLALMSALWGMVFFMQGYRSKKWWPFILSQIFFALATATKLPFIIFFAIPWTYELALVFSTKGKSFLVGLTRVLPGFLLVLLPIAWYMWVIPMWLGNGVIKGVLETTMEEVPELLRILGANIFSILPELLVNYAAVPFLIFGIWKIWKQKRYKHILFFPFGMMALGAGSYFIFEINMISTVHDYYLFPFMPGIFMLVAFGLSAAFKLEKKGWKIFVMVLLLLLPVTAGLRSYSRWSSRGMPRHLMECAEEIRNVVPEDAIIISGHDFSPHISLYHLRRFGWTVKKNKLKRERLKSCRKIGAQYFVSNSREIEEDEAFEGLLGEIVLQCHDYKVWKLK